MSPFYVSLGIDRLSADDQVKLAYDILDNLGMPRDLSPEQSAEIERRVASIDAGASKLHSWEEVEARVLAGLRQ